MHFCGVWCLTVYFAIQSVEQTQSLNKIANGNSRPNIIETNKRIQDAHRGNNYVCIAEMYHL